MVPWWYAAVKVRLHLMLATTPIHSTPYLSGTHLQTNIFSSRDSRRDSFAQRIAARLPKNRCSVRRGVTSHYLYRAYKRPRVLEQPTCITPPREGSGRYLRYHLGQTLRGHLGEQELCWIEECHPGHRGDISLDGFVTARAQSLLPRLTPQARDFVLVVGVVKRGLAVSRLSHRQRLSGVGRQ